MAIVVTEPDLLGHRIPVEPHGVSYALGDDGRNPGFDVIPQYRAITRVGGNHAKVARDPDGGIQAFIVPIDRVEMQRMLLVPNARHGACCQGRQRELIVVGRKLGNQLWFGIFEGRVDVADAVEPTCRRVKQVAVAVRNAVWLFKSRRHHIDAIRFARGVKGQCIDEISNGAFISIGREGTGPDIQYVIAHGHLSGLNQALGKQFDFITRQGT